MPSVAIVTGGNSGIGFAIAEKLVQLPDTTVVITARNETAAKVAVEEIKSSSGKQNVSFYCPLDITNDEHLKNFQKWAEMSYSEGIDVFFNNAGFAFKPDATESVGTQAKESCRINYFGTKKMTECVLPLMKKDGKIIATASGAGKMVYPKMSEELKTFFKKSGMTLQELDSQVNHFVTVSEKGEEAQKDAGFPTWNYAFSKLAVLKLTEIFADDPVVKEKNILCVSFCPGWCKTKMAGFDQPPKTAEEGARTAMTPLMYSPKTYQTVQGKFFQKEEVSDWY